MTTAAAPASATASTVRSTSRMPTPARTATSLARWITGPSMTGSEYGRPTSIEVDTRLDQRPASRDRCLDVGKPAGR